MRSRRELIQLAGAGLAVHALAPLARSRASSSGSSATELVAIPAGWFLMGTTAQQVASLAAAHGYHASWFDGEQPQKSIHLPAYAIEKYPVTNLQFARFCEEIGHPPPIHWKGPQPPAQILDHPVTHVSRGAAQAYAQWRGRRLPTEAEWEKAARGVAGWIHPWGDSFDPLACQWNSDSTSPGPGTAPVDAHPSGVSPFGVHDMVGNVGEWCSDGPSPWTAYIKGGSWVNSEVVNLRPAARNMSGNSNNPLPFYGFRCAKDLP